VGPETDDLDGFLLVVNLIDVAMLDANSPRTSTRQIAFQLLVRRGALVWIVLKNLEQLDGLVLQPAAASF